MDLALGVPSIVEHVNPALDVHQCGDQRKTRPRRCAFECTRCPLRNKVVLPLLVPVHPARMLEPGSVEVEKLLAAEPQEVEGPREIATSRVRFRVQPMTLARPLRLKRWLP